MKLPPLPTVSLPPLPTVKPSPPKQYRRRWHCDDLPNQTFRVVARGNYTRQEVIQLREDIKALLLEAGVPVLDVEDRDDKNILISRTDDGMFLCIQGNYTVEDTHLILRKLK